MSNYSTAARMAALTGNSFGYSVDMHRNDNQWDGTVLDHERARQMALAYQQRRVKHLKGLVGNKAATINNRLRISQGLPMLIAMLTGGLSGAGLGALSHGKHGALVGGILGSATGMIGSGILGAIGSAKGALADSDREQLKKDLNNISLANYLVPGISANLAARLDKDFIQDEEDRPQQYIV